MYISRGAEPRNKLYYCDLSSLEGGKITGILPMQKLIDDFEASWDVSDDDPLPNHLLLLLMHFVVHL